MVKAIVVSLRCFLLYENGRNPGNVAAGLLRRPDIVNFQAALGSPVGPPPKTDNLLSPVIVSAHVRR